MNNNNIFDFEMDMDACMKEEITLREDYGDSNFLCDTDTPFKEEDKPKRRQPHKILYFDLETTGLNHDTCGITELAAIVIEDGEEIDSFLGFINPYTQKSDSEVEISTDALEVTGKTVEDFKSYSDSNEVFLEFRSFLEKHINKFEPSDKFTLSGYNVAFDINFLKVWFIDNSEKWYGSYFTHKEIDIYALVKHFKALKLLSLQNEKLGTVCEHYNIPLDAHKAIDDIRATRILYHTMLKNIGLEKQIKYV